jgi:signal transduction histidine kinase
MPPNDPLDSARRALITDMAAQAGLVARNVRLIEDLRASRQRLVAAQDEERRKLELNIHDGAQQQLVALAVQLNLAERMAGSDPYRERELLAGLGAQVHETLEDLRNLAHGIFPPLLADQGLPAALESQARRAAVPVTLETDGVGRYPQEIEAAVYFCTLEALNNVAKYANAGGVRVTLAQADGHLSFAVTDDGVGFDPVASTHGSGLQGMADRLDAIDGTLEIVSAPGNGTTVHGTVPAPAPPRSSQRSARTSSPRRGTCRCHRRASGRGGSR